MLKLVRKNDVYLVRTIAWFCVFMIAGCSTDKIVAEKTKMSNETDKITHQINNTDEDRRMIAQEKIIVLMENKPSSFFVYRGAKMGYEYELLSEFAKNKGLKLEVKIVNNRNELIPMLQHKKGDIIACNYVVTRERSKHIQYSTPYLDAKQVLIQRKMNEHGDIAIKTATDIKQKKVHVWGNSIFYKRLIHLQEEIGDTIYVQRLNGNIGTEELIEQVANGTIDYTIAEYNVAQIAAKFYQNIDFSVAISVQQDIAFGLRKESAWLKKQLDQWLDSFLTTSKHRYIYKKYYQRGWEGMNPTNLYSSLGKKRISPYDDFFREASTQYALDWRLCAAVAYQESRFSPQAIGFGGSYGIMQFMPNTGPYYGVFPDSSPKIQIHGGAKKISADLQVWKDIPDYEQRMKFALASYNAGRGHVQDACRLAKKFHLNPKIWDGNVERTMILLSQQRHHNDEVVKHGFVRGTITTNYVREIMERYHEWTMIFPQ